ncbi:MAG: bifunctional (p)ppGpp synthetase/guanosine-3',5'-bis(diphosphate) 3'-pyrophosphohydrolase, partial [Clostridia bacterium]|nr:bifunctional (p)ppGpp synthetase/guanosine-3',5'-bis(diphosphate) 3'-pyrophosphohydrolase [Clostridia bacterium]
ENHDFLGDITQKVGDRVREFIPNAHMESRTKSIHGIYRKMYAQNKNFEEIYDVYAVRIIVDSVNDCYNALGVIHDMYRPIPGRFKDYISTPKPNKYQSLHTTVIGREGIPFEVQIRTWDMHHTAEFGIAAHWKYKEGISGKDNMDDHLTWVRQILDAQKDSGDVEDILQSIKIDLSQEDVFAVTPKGDVINLPVGSTVIDFAFAIHTQVGCRMVGAKVDGKIVPLTHEVKTGQIIEILTTNQAGHGPSRDWMNIVKTSQARNKIRSWFKKERRTENIADGKEQFEKECLRSGVRIPAEMLPEYLEKLADRQHFTSVDEFFAAIGYGGLVLSRIMPRIKEDYQKMLSQKQMDIADYVEEEKKTKGSPDGVRIEGIDNCLIKLSRCCSPLPGDEIIGFITRGHGVSVHKRQCSNVPKIIEGSPDAERWVKAYWTGGAKQQGFKTYIKITAVDRQGVLADVTALLLGMHVAMHAVSAKELRSGSCTINLTISVENIEHLKNICQKLDRIPGVYRVERTNG